MTTNKKINTLFGRVVLIVFFLINVSCKETENERLIKKIEIGQKRNRIQNKIGYPDFSYISDTGNIIDKYNNDNQFDAPLVLIYRSNDSILINKSIDW